MYLIMDKVYNNFLDNIYIISHSIEKMTKTVNNLNKGFSNRIMIEYSLKQKNQKFTNVQSKIPFKQSTSDVAQIKQESQKLNYEFNPTKIYLPTYISVKLQSIDKLTIAQNKATVNIIIYFRVYFGNFNKQFIRKCCEKLELGPGRDDQFKLCIKKSEKDSKQQDQQTQLNQDDSQSEEEQQEAFNIHQKQFDQVNKIQVYVIRKSFQVDLQPFPFFTPFQIHDLILRLELRSFKVNLTQKNQNYKKEIDVKLNLMSVQDSDKSQKMRKKLINSSQFSAQGQYCLAEALLTFENTADRSDNTLKQLYNWKYLLCILLPCFNNDNFFQRSQKPKQYQSRKDITKNFQYANFHFPIYREPLVAFLSMYLPLWTLSIITLSLYFSTNSFGKRLICIAALNLAFVPTIKIIREQIPQTRYITLLQVGVYLQVISTIFLLIQNITKKGLKQDQYVFQPYENPYYLVSLSIFLVMVVIPLMGYIIFKLIKNKLTKSIIKIKQSQQKSGEQDNSQNIFDFNKNQWDNNKQANQYFFFKYQNSERQLKQCKQKCKKEDASDKNIKQLKSYMAIQVENRQSNRNSYSNKLQGDSNIIQEQGIIFDKLLQMINLYQFDCLKDFVEGFINNPNKKQE